jgi:ParB family chromosome partitioning protein
MSRKNVFSHKDRTADAPHPASPPPTALQRATSVSSMGLVLNNFDQKNRRADEALAQFEDLQRQLQEAQDAKKIDPAVIDPSPVRDRLDDPTSAAAESLKTSIEEHGQQIPVLLRPNPKTPGRYITVFGHRRVAAAKALNRPVKAMIREMTDEDAFIVQGQENNERENTSFIERCMFAKRLKLTGLSLPKISAALSKDKADVSRMVDIASKIPDDLVLAIGPSPSIGRDRWVAFAEAFEANPEIHKSVVVTDEFKSLASSDRFLAVFSALTAGRSGKSMSAKFLSVADRNGDRFLAMKRSAAGDLTMKIQRDDGACRADGKTFADWVEEHIPSFRNEWLDGR